VVNHCDLLPGRAWPGIELPLRGCFRGSASDVLAWRPIARRWSVVCICNWRCEGANDRADPPTGQTGVDYKKIADITDKAKAACTTGEFLGHRGALTGEAATATAGAAKALADAQRASEVSKIPLPPELEKQLRDDLTKWQNYLGRVNTWNFSPPVAARPRQRRLPPLLVCRLRAANP